MNPVELSGLLVAVFGLVTPTETVGPLVRSYLNLVIFNGIVLVPVFDDDQAHESNALEIIQDAFPERVVIPIAVDFLAEDNGTLHCISRTIPFIEST